MLFTLKVEDRDSRNPDFYRLRNYQFKNFYDLYKKVGAMIDKSDSYMFSSDYLLCLKRKTHIVTCEISNIYKKIPVKYIMESYA